MLPEKSGRRDGERVRHVPCITARRGGEGALYVVTDEGLHQPLVSVETDRASGVEIVEHDILLYQRVMIRGDVAAIHAQLGIAVAFAEVAEYLVVGAVLLDDEEDVLDPQ